VNPEAKGDCSEEIERTNEDPDELPDEQEKMTLAQRNGLGHFGSADFANGTRMGSV
jgi:hypothetical protein